MVKKHNYIYYIDVVTRRESGAGAPVQAKSSSSKTPKYLKVFTLLSRKLLSRRGTWGATEAIFLADEHNILNFAF